ncbi:MAG: hypothetical protein J2P37_35210, partial [Ktedonobacteraceae bacterium]|nr:hypothetical protein [Ktedonobacteraceae bacterium]
IVCERPEAGNNYDTSFQDYLNEHIGELLPQFLTGAVYQNRLDVTIIRPTMRSDRVYRVIYHDKPHIVHFEIQIGYEKKFPARLHVYNSVLNYDHTLPVITIVIYPFRVAMASSPYLIQSGERLIDRFEFVTVPLFEQDARKFVRNQVLSMYPLLPTMQYVDQKLIQQVMTELAAFYGENEYALGRQFKWLRLCLNRTDTISDMEKERIQEVLMMYNRLWEEDPDVQRTRAVGRNEGIIVGRNEGKLENQREMILLLVEKRFPHLKEMAEQHIAQIGELSELRSLFDRLLLETSEETVHTLLQPSSQHDA